MKHIELEDRACDCCDGENLEPLWEYSFSARTRNHTFGWQVRNVICRDCGFAFVSPAPTEQSLNEYYADTHSIFAGQSLDYSISRRLSVIKKYAQGVAERSYVEIGSNDCPEFLAELSTHCHRIETVEVNDSCTKTYSSLQDVPSAHADILASYFVLEHVPKPGQFLQLCAQALKPSGILIVEVPNLHLYPKDPSGLFPYEHVNHFSPCSLTRLANRCGLTLVEIGHASCSREFGFVAVFQTKSGSREAGDSSSSAGERINARACLSEGVEAIRQFHERLRKARRAIDQAEYDRAGNTVLWGANTICAMLLEGYALPRSAMVVDSDSRKADFLAPLPVRQPVEALRQIAAAKLLVINTRRHAAAIREWIVKRVGRRFSDAEVLVVDFL